MNPRQLVAFLGIVVIAVLVSYTAGSATQDAVASARPIIGASAPWLTTFTVLLLLTGAVSYVPTGARALWDRELSPSIAILTSSWTLASGLAVFVGLIPWADPPWRSQRLAMQERCSWPLHSLGHSSRGSG
jgi:hypothetical protein